MAKSMAQSNPADKIDHIFEDLNRPNAPGAVVSVIRAGEVIFSKAYGLANLETGQRCTTNTNFRIASVTKQFTAAAILILAERGKLSLNDPMIMFFPEAPLSDQKITIQHLLTHTSGLWDYEDLIPDGTKIPVSDRNVLHLVRQQKKTYFPPGSKFRYSNTGYALLALIVEAVSGRNFPEFLKREIFLPLGMTGTIAYEAGLSTVRNRALGYARNQGGIFVLSDQSLTSAVLGDGGIYSSAADLYHWDQALYTSKLLKMETLKLAFMPWSPTSDMPGSAYGFGWYISQIGETPHIWHYGSTCGFSTAFHRYPERKLSIIILSNVRDLPMTERAEKLRALYEP
jgi:CubicO group peptidase (beta-lactamase class C family)